MGQRRRQSAYALPARRDRSAERRPFVGSRARSLAAAGRISIEEARCDPRRHMLRSAVTGEDLDLVDLSWRPLQIEPGDYVILASDGVQTLEAGESSVSFRRMPTMARGGGRCPDPRRAGLERAASGQCDGGRDTPDRVLIPGQRRYSLYGRRFERRCGHSLRRQPTLRWHTAIGLWQTFSFSIL